MGVLKTCPEVVDNGLVAKSLSNPCVDGKVVDDHSASADRGNFQGGIAESSEKEMGSGW